VIEDKTEINAKTKVRPAEKLKALRTLTLGLEKSRDRRKQAEGESWDAATDIVSGILTILNALPLYVLLIDSSHHILLANDAVRADLGLEPDQILGGYCPKVVHGVTGSYPGCPLEEAVKTGQAVERELFDENTERWMRSAIYPTKIDTKDGGEIYLHMVWNITEQKRAEERVRLLSQAVESAPDGLQIVDLNGYITYSSKAVEKIFGFTPEEFEGKHVNDMNVDPEFAAKVIIPSIKETGGWQGELLVKHKSGKHFPIWLTTSTVIGSEGKPIAMVGVIKDITEKKRAEEELRNYKDHLEELVKQRSADLQKSNQQLHREISRSKLMEKKIKVVYEEEKRLRHELQEQLQQRTDFTRALVHELKTPLTPVLAASDVLFANLEKEPWRSLAKNISLGAYQLNKRTDELFDVAKGEIGMMVLDHHSLDPLQLLTDLVDYMTPEAAKRGLSLKLEAPRSLRNLWADEDRLRQIVLNLLDNALKFTPRGGKITVRAGEKANDLIVEVQDTGPGIAREEKQWLFEPYRRLEREARHSGGLGLGLALFKMLVELHRGTVWVKSKKGRGSTFGFSIPIDDRQSI
jgi:PAS domain S-box-containing protein